MASLWDRLLQGQAPTPRDIPANWDRRTTAQPAKTWLQDQGNYLANFGRQAVETLDPGIGLASQIGADAGRGNYASAAMGLPLLAMSVAPGPAPKPKGITAYHGSPHDFDKFDLSKIGTGEGAQAYGHGLYFAENEGVARSYRDALSPAHVTLGNDSFEWGNLAKRADPSMVAKALNISDMAMADTATEIIGEAVRKKIHPADVAEMVAGESLGQVGEHAKILAPMLRGADWASTGAEPFKGRMYEVRINADPEQFLDWDKPLSQQSEAVRNALPQDLPPDMTGQEVLNEVRQFLMASQPRSMADTSSFFSFNNSRPEVQSQISSAMREKGIPGIRYLDQGSRTAGEGSRNYVVFSDDIVEILRKYGLIPGAYAGASLADMLTSADEPQY